MIEKQIDAVFEDIEVDAVKIGMLRYQIKYRRLDSSKLLA